MLEEHRGYARDSSRIDRFRQAIGCAVAPGDAVLDLGCGVGVLGLLCLEAGAGRVIGIERSAVAEVALESYRRAGAPERVEVVRGESHQVELPEPVDVIVCDHVGYLGIDYGIVHLLKDARARLLKPGGRIVPSGLSLHLAIVGSESCHATAWRWKAAAIPRSLHWLAGHDVNSVHDIRLSRSDLLADAAVLGEIDLTTEERDFFSWRAAFTAARDGRIDGLAGWFDCCLAGDVHMTNAPEAEGSIDRPQAFLPLEQPLVVAEGDAVEASLAMRPADGLIAWTVSHPASGKSVRQSTLHAYTLDAADVRRTRPDHVPRLNPRARARQIVLGYCDGERTVREIEKAVLDRHPELMPSPEALSDFVAEVLGRETE